jgi:hypothetical protein
MEARMDIDRELVDRVRQLITNTNTQNVTEWIYLYETSVPGSACSRRYEALLRNFVLWMKVEAMASRSVRQRVNVYKGVSTKHDPAPALINAVLNRSLGAR